MEVPRKKTFRVERAEHTRSVVFHTTWEAFRALRSEGKVRYFGLGCVERAHHVTFMEALGEEAAVILTVNDYNILRRYGAEGDWAKKKEETDHDPYVRVSAGDSGCSSVGGE